MGASESLVRLNGNGDGFRKMFATLTLYCTRPDFVRSDPCAYENSTAQSERSATDLTCLLVPCGIVDPEEELTANRCILFLTRVFMQRVWWACHRPGTVKAAKTLR